MRGLTAAARVLRRLYPADLRRLHGAELEEALLERFRVAHATGGLAGLARAWGLAVADVLRSRPHCGAPRRPGGARWRADVRDASRQVWRRRGRALSVVVTMSVALTSTVMALAVAYELSARPLPFPDAHRLVTLARVSAERAPLGVTLGDVALLSSAPSVQAIAAFNDFDATLWAGTLSTREPGAYATANLAGVLGVAPVAGAWFSVTDDRPGAPGVAVLSSRLARDLFGSIEAAVSARLRIQGETYTVSGVMDDRFAFPVDAQFWIPAGRQPSYARSANLDLTAVARLAEGATLEQAQFQADAAVPSLAVTEERAAAGLGVRPLRDTMIDPGVRRFITPLLITAALTLLMAASSVTHVFVMAATERRVEFQVRRALGGGVTTAMRLLLLEAAMLAAAAAATAAVAGRAIGAALPHLMDVRLPPFVAFMPSGPVLALAALVTALLTIVSAIVAGWPLMGSNEAVQQTRGAGGGASMRMARRFGIVQVATAGVLTAAALWAAGGFRAFQRTDPGFDPSAFFVTYSLAADARYDRRNEREVFLQALLREVSGMPGHVASGVVGRRPIDSLQDEQWADPGLGTPPIRLTSTAMTPGYLDAAGIRLIGGRDTSWADRSAARTTAVVSRAAARLLWGAEAWAGERTLRIAAAAGDLSSAPVVHVVGLAEDTHPRGLEHAAAPAIYLTPPAARWTPWVGHVTIRSTSSPSDTLRHLRRIVTSLDPGVPLYRWRTMEELMERSLWRSRLAAWLLSALGCVALVATVVGVHAMMGGLVRERLEEFGIRAALGATTADLASSVARWTLPLAVWGIGAAAVLTALVSTPVRALLPAAPGLAWPFAAAAVVVVTAVAAAAVPAMRRAGRADPAELLRGL